MRLLPILLLLIVGCVDDSNRKDRVFVVTDNGHEFIGNFSGGIMHHPGCPCWDEPPKVLDLDPDTGEVQLPSVQADRIKDLRHVRDSLRQLNADLRVRVDDELIDARWHLDTEGTPGWKLLPK